jgi:IclR family transcriptional regulator, pca regulon regulatory protein
MAVLPRFGFSIRDGALRHVIRFDRAEVREYHERRQCQTDANGASMNSSGGKLEREAAPDAATGPASNPKNVVNSVAKAFQILQSFDAASPALSVSELAQMTGLDRGTTFRLVHTLASLGYLRQAGNRQFGLTLKVLELGFNALAGQGLPAYAAPLLAACVPDIADAASLGTLDGAEVVFLQRVQSGLKRNVDRHVGQRIQAYASALGHAMLAYLPETRQIELLESAERTKLSERTLTDLDELLERLRQVKQQGYAVSDGENAYGLRTLAVPILDGDSRPVAGVSFTVNAERMSVKELIKLALPRASEIARELSHAVRVSPDPKGR